MMTARRHSPLHNNEPELIGYFASPLGISKSICPAGVEFKRGRTSSSHLRKQMPFALHVAANEYRIARRCPPASLPANRQFFRMIAIPRRFFSLFSDKRQRLGGISFSGRSSLMRQKSAKVFGISVFSMTALKRSAPGPNA